MVDAEAHEPTDPTALEPAVAEAAYRSAAATLESVEEALEENNSPVVAAALQDASAEAATTVGRLDWLRHRLRKPRTRGWPNAVRPAVHLAARSEVEPDRQAQRTSPGQDGTQLA